MLNPKIAGNKVVTSFFSQKSGIKMALKIGSIDLDFDVGIDLEKIKIMKIKFMRYFVLASPSI